MSIDLIKENSFTIKNSRSRQSSAETLKDADYADDLVFLINTPSQIKSQQHSLDQAAKVIGLYMNTNKTEYMCFKQKGTISTLHGRPQKLVDKFTYLSSNISSTESDVNLHQAKGTDCYSQVINLMEILSLQ